MLPGRVGRWGRPAWGGALAQSEHTGKATFTDAMTRTHSSSYTLEKNVTYSTGPFEDGVVFSTVPYDRYVYKIVQGFGGKFLENGPVAVDQGTGSNSADIDVSHAHAVGGSLEVGFQVDVEAVGATLLGGFSVGVSRQAAFSWTSNSSTPYHATVGAIEDPSDFTTYGYQYGMFTYVYVEGDPTQPRDQRPQFEVINFWVQ